MFDPHALNDTPKWFRDLPIGAQMIEETRASLMAQRTALREQMVAAERRWEKDGPRLAQASENARLAMEQVEAEVLVRLQEARNTYHAAHNECSQAQVAFEREQRRLEVDLQRTADPCIDTFIAEMHEEFERSRHLTETTIVAPSRKDTVFGTYIPETVVTNRVQVLARLEAIREAMKAAELLRLSPDPDVGREIAELRKSLPPVHAITVEPATPRRQ